MAFVLKKFEEYLCETAGTHQKLIESPPKVIVEIEPHAANENIEKPLDNFIAATTKSTEELEEQAYILANDMNLPIEWATAIVKLRAAGKPKSILLDRWLEIQEICNQFYRDDFGLLKLIINHDWALSDIYGCHSEVPLFRSDMMGLILLLHKGDEVVGVNKHRIKILKSSSSKLVFSKRLEPTGKGVLLHELEV